MQMRFVQAGGVPTRCLEAGHPDAPALLLVHGLTLTCDLWMRNVDALAQHFHVIAPDMLGHGFTRPVLAPHEVDVAAKVEHLLSLMDACGHQRFAVSGSSYGALIAANIYLAAPARVSRLVLNGSGSCFSTEAQLVEAVGRAHASYDALMDASDPEGWRHHLDTVVHAPASVPEALPSLLALAYAQPWIAAYWRATIAAMRDAAQFQRFRVLERLHEIDVDTLILWGRDDKGARYENAQAAVEKLPRARLIGIDACGHLPMLEQPAAVNEAMQSFLLQDAR
ncbi:4,5:9,10-diseco-3-hydroxy-5,9, 17-trioxoandrosta-1(10),2-diene-4-oate hydrolase (plasmid) [Variovorax sp. SRS16]|uniref:alpha/beta fold hydrolase n=1 Tax=Variovorax sp. SRS16 TaxID=282217 RepID=UPI001315BDDC|nr:alpha/beta hydrolase [Variovorax sp. SRS16]VTU45951.1 4,5:9,10-diseco-3-hydroxy-5,9, 17-trioxoandrosta-1(10),2-diene-4-oate hydrolase [Variovorax sp. SRS16]